MKLVLFRHGERENAGTSNPPLSLRGLKQAECLAEWVRSGRLPPPSRLLCSPKIRTQLTFGALSKELGLNLQILNELDERVQIESHERFERRVRTALNSLEQASGVHYLCTHLDWLEVALRHIASDTDLTQDKYLNCWMPGHFMIFDTSSTPWIFEQMETLSL